MKIALASAPVRNGDVAYNLSQMARYISMARDQGADLVCFGEAYLQGFDALEWHYAADRGTAVSCSSPLFQILSGWTKDSGVDLLVGFLERDGEAIYSSCALICGGVLKQKYRRVSRGWKECTRTDEHYREGTEVAMFEYRGRRCLMALCGDLWDDTAPMFRQNAELLFWPVWIDYTKEEWEQGVQAEYAQKAAEFSGQTLLINPLGGSAHGGSCLLSSGSIAAALPMDEEGLLVVEL